MKRSKRRKTFFLFSKTQQGKKRKHSAEKSSEETHKIPPITERASPAEKQRRTEKIATPKKRENKAEGRIVLLKREKKTEK